MGSASDKRRAREAAARRVRKRLGAPGVKRAAKAKITTNVKSGGGGGGGSKTVTQPVVTTAQPATTSAAKPQVTQASQEKALEPFTKTPYQQIQERQITYAASIGREEIPTRYPQGVTEKPKSRFQRAEELVARRVTQPIARAAAARGVTKERVAKAVTAVTVKQFEKSPFLTQQQVEARRREQEALVKGAAEGLQQQPLKTGAVFVAGAALGPTVSGAQLAAAKVAPATFLKAAPIVQKGFGITGKALGATYVGTKAFEYRALPTPEARGAFVGRTLATEVGPFVAGIKTTGTFAARVQERAMVEATIAAKTPRATQMAFAETKALAREVRKANLPVQNPRIGEVLSPKAAKVTSQHFAKKGKARVVYGSAAQRSDVKPGDIDVAARNPYQAAVEYADALQKAGIKDVVVPPAALRRAAATGIEEATVFVGGKAVTFHTFKQLASNPFYMGKFQKSPSGVYVQQPAEQLLRKFTGATYYGRAKDVPSFEELSLKLSKQVAAKPSKIGPAKTPTPTKGIGYYPVPKAPTAYPYPKAPKTPSYAYPRAPKAPSYAFPSAPKPAAYPRPPSPSRGAYTPPTRTPPAAYFPTTAPAGYPGLKPTPAPAYRPFQQPRKFLTQPAAGLPTFRLPRREFKPVRFTVPKRALTQPKRYTPTLRAAVGSIKARKGKKFRLTGLEERPIIF
tara:strand:+ start:851 stop:2896 length:2046 start_codon:yes stop_codon:yes gene_type:complete